MKASSRRNRTDLVLAVLFAIAMGLHVGVNAAAAIYAPNASSFTAGPLDVLASGLSVGLATAALFLLFGAIGLLPVGRAVGRTAAWSGIFLVIGFSFSLFITGDLLDGRLMDWPSQWPRMVIESVLFVGGLFIVLSLPMRPWRFILSMAVLYVLISFAGNVFAIVPEAMAALKNRDGPAQAINTDELQPNQMFFLTNPAGVPGMDLYSKERNVIVILVDTMQGDIAEKMFEAEPAIKSSLDGFTLYRNAAGVYPTTFLSIPMIFSGLTLPRGENVEEYIRAANAVRFDRRLQEAGYGTNFLSLLDRGVYAFGAAAERARSINRLWSVVTYRQVPMIFKAAFMDPEIDFMGNDEAEAFWDDRDKDAAVLGGGLAAVQADVSVDTETLRLLTANVQATADRPQFKFIHLWGAHLPSVLGRDCRRVDGAIAVRPYMDQATCIFALLGGYFDRLRDAGVYDSSEILVIGDHGTTQFPIPGYYDKPTDIPFRVQSSAHPLILFKEFGAAGALRQSDAPVSLKDIPATILHGAGLGQSGERDLKTATFENAPTREYLFYESAEEPQTGEFKTLQRYTVGPNVRSLDGWAKR